MKTIKVDILQEEALNLLRDLEALKVIRLLDVDPKEEASTEIKSAKGKTFVARSHEEIEQRLRDLRNEWDSLEISSFS
ncbi:hypothetical protein [Mucilaginibacter agri]|uniref:Uncharacterized protein n=1 Tax=Mucilaginibacter agri TaxID=2695265 RepID=A0A966DUD7_9SPHI|nr:hypothetical protein [Mucilaginibacter agri]NCD71620.1 hypothetical protein [Mucilaginibacter agri]